MESRVKIPDDTQTDVQRPLLTLAVIAYAQEAFVADAVRGALAQTYTPLEIIVSDDCSPDGTYEVMRRIVAEYRGPHSVVLNQTPTNLRLAPHLNLVAGMARGELIAVAAGDDISDPERMMSTWKAYQRSEGRALSIFGNAIVIDAEGRERGPYEGPRSASELTATALAQTGSGVLGCTHSVHRSLFEIFGPLHPDTHSEDIVLPFRAALLGTVEYVDEIMARYRLHDTNRHFRDPSRITNVPEFYSALRKVAPGVVADFRTRLRDIDTAERLAPHRAAEFAALRRVCAQRLSEFEAELQMLSTDSRWRRLGIIYRALQQGTATRRAARWMLTFFFPRLYLWLQSALQQRARRDGGATTA